MAIAEVIKFEGPRDALVWKHPAEDFNATSQLIVDETHEALLVVNGNAADLFSSGRHTLSVPNIPIARKLLEIPTGGDSPFSCKVFFIKKVHNMDLKWGTFGPIALEDPCYSIFLHVMANGSMTVAVEDSRKFVLKMAGFVDLFAQEELVPKFRGIISTHVKDALSKIMIIGILSYFAINANLFEISIVVKERLDKIFEEYGISIQIFNIETVAVPEEDYKKVSEAKERRASRMIEGYSWQEERQMAIAERFAGNEGTMGSVGGAVGGFMMGGMMGGSILDIARSALDPERIPKDPPPKDAKGRKVYPGEEPKNVDTFEFFRTKDQKNTESESKTGKCPKCGSDLPENAKFCLECGEVINTADTIVCPYCGKTVRKGKFCPECGKKVSSGTCPKCGAQLPDGAKFCLECGEKL